MKGRIYYGSQTRHYDELLKDYKNPEDLLGDEGPIKALIDRAVNVERPTTLDMKPMM
ncbi:hypothetical protein [Paremcibacter congregatus]|uniref:hypothetical protein n=1 Tax=Paremcibacter congregatus TaxID=2043170 RepID=UPI0013FD567E|nr:hypothetical protein [Paremcibacter congregatus]